MPRPATSALIDDTLMTRRVTTATGGIAAESSRELARSPELFGAALMIGLIRDARYEDRSRNVARIGSLYLRAQRRSADLLWYL